MGRCVLLLVVLLALTSSFVTAQTTEGSFVTAQTTDDTVTEVVTEFVTVLDAATTGESGEEEPAPTDAPEVETDPCATNPCNGTAHTQCVALDSIRYVCNCIPGYSSNSNGVCAAAQSFLCEMAITQVDGVTIKYSEALADPSSTEFQNLAASVEESIDIIYLASALADIYLGAVVVGFSDGSVIANYTVRFLQEDTSGDSAVPVSLNISQITTAFTTALEEQALAGNIHVTIDPSSIVIEDFDECVSADDNNCHLNAACTNIVGSFTCECTELFRDISPTDSPGTDCEALPPNRACDSSPCNDFDKYAECVPVGATGYDCPCIEGYEQSMYKVCDIPGRQTEFRCYTCHDEIENLECNGRTEDNVNGTVQWCPNPTDTCFSTVQMNPDGDGWMIRKGCMDKEDCYDIFFSQEQDPDYLSCLEFIWPYGAGTTPEGGLTCHYCCNEYLPLDLCNQPSIGLIYESPPVNNWDPRMKWDLTLDYVTPTPPSAAERQLPIGILGVLVSALLTIILH